MGYSKTVISGKIIKTFEYEYNLPYRARGKRRLPLQNKRFFGRRYGNVLESKRKFNELLSTALESSKSVHFVTLTMASVVSISQAWGYFTDFTALLRRYYGPHFRYFAVPEYHQPKTSNPHYYLLKDRIHFHVLFLDLPELSQEKNPKTHPRGTRYFQNLWRRGFLDCTTTDGSPRLAGYLTKYMLKALHTDRLNGARAFTISRNVVRPLSLSYASAVTHLHTIVGGVPSILKKRTYKTKWLGLCNVHVYQMPSDSENTSLPAGNASPLPQPNNQPLCISSIDDWDQWEHN